MRESLFPVDTGKIYWELDRLASFYLEGQQSDFLLEQVRLSVRRLRTLLPEDPDLADGASLVAIRSLWDFVRWTAAVYHLDDPAGLPVPAIFSEQIAEQLHCLIRNFRPRQRWDEDIDQEDSNSEPAAAVGDQAAGPQKTPVVFISSTSEDLKDSRLGSLLAKIRDGAGQFLDAFQRAVSGEGGITWPLFTLEIADPGNGGTIEIPGERPPVTISNFAICRLNVPVSETDVGTAARYLRDWGLPHDAQRLEDEFQDLKNAFFSVGEYVALPDGTMANRKFLAQMCAVALLGHLNDLIGAIRAVRPAGDRKSRVQAAVCDGQPGGAADETAPDLHRKFMEMAIDEARKSVSEKGRDNPKVGVVVVRDRIVLATAHRGELGMGEHAEFTALEKKLPDETLGDTTVYTTLEPCTTRNHPKVPCANRLIERRVTRVVIGMLDPNPAICGRGERLLRDHGIEVERFPHDLIVRLEELNRDFTRTHCHLPGREKLESPTQNEYQRQVVDRLARLSDELYSEFNPASPEYLTAQLGLQEAILLIHKEFEQSKDAILAAGEWEGWVILPRDTLRFEKILEPVRSDPFIPNNIRKVVIELLERRLAAFSEISNELLLDYRDALASGKIKPDDENWLPIMNRMNTEMTRRNCGPAQVEAAVHEIRRLIQEYFDSFNSQTVKGGGT